MNTNKYNLTNIKIGNKVLFTRTGINDFRMYWEVVGFLDNMIEVEIDEMGNKEKLFIDIENIDKIL